MGVKGYKDTINWYEENAKKYAEKSKEHSVIDKQQLDEFSSMLPAQGKVLDAGCGSGRDTNLFQKNGFNVFGLDISKKLIEEARKSYPKTKFIEGDMLNLPFKDNSFDGVWAHASLVHFDKDEQIIKALSEFNRILKKEGIIHFLIRAQKNGTKTEVVSDSLSEHNRFFRYFKKEELEELIKNAGFEIIKLQQYNESELDPNKRPGEGIEWILTLGRKI